MSCQIRKVFESQGEKRKGKKREKKKRRRKKKIVRMQRRWTGLFGIEMRDRRGWSKCN
jgi:hypothetical protein